MDLVLDLILVFDFSFQILVVVKILLFFESTTVHQCRLIMKKDILALGEKPTQGLDDTTITAEAKCSINSTRSKKKLFNKNYMVIPFIIMKETKKQFFIC